MSVIGIQKERCGRHEKYLNNGQSFYKFDENDEPTDLRNLTIPKQHNHKENHRKEHCNQFGIMYFNLYKGCIEYFTTRNVCIFRVKNISV